MTQLNYAQSRCQSCGVAAACRPVSFNQNIGMLFARRGSSFNGNVCKSCLHKRYWSMTGTTLAVGWLGTISAILTPIFVLGNTYYYLRNIGMEPVAKAA